MITYNANGLPIAYSDEEWYRDGMTRAHGIHYPLKALRDEPIVYCQSCERYYYEECWGDERNDFFLVPLEDEDGGFFGCPICKTDKNLTDVTVEEILA